VRLHFDRTDSACSAQSSKIVTGACLLEDTEVLSSEQAPATSEEQGHHLLSLSGTCSLRLARMFLGESQEGRRPRQAHYTIHIGVLKEQAEIPFCFRGKYA
jgi:hypothetical protein